MSEFHRKRIEEEQNIEDLFSKYYPSLVAYAHKFLTAQEAEDIVQEAFLEIWEKRGGIVFGENIGGLLFKSVYFKAINLIKHKKVENVCQDAMVEIAEARLVYFGSEQRDGLRLMVLNEDRVEIEKAIDELPEKCREVFKLSYLYGLKNKDIADALQLSLRTVEAHIYKALKFLRERLVGLVSMVVCFFSVIRF